MSISRNTSDFFEIDLPSYASYDNVRKICSFTDGLKISMRKILFTMLEKYPGKEKTKTDSVANTCATYTNYLHGAANICGVCNTMAQSFVGANNFSLIEGNSSGFGTRINPDCAASRYTKIALSPIVEVLLNTDDLAIVEPQFFEGTYIEPKYFMPIFPILFLNGSHGLSTGFSQDIYPRNPLEVIDYIVAKINNKKYNKELLPWFKGFTGEILKNELDKIECHGVIIKNNMTSYTITELPIGLDYSKYIEILNKLCDDNIIVDYDDLCDTKTDTIKFEIKTTREFTRKYESNNEVLSILKLIKNLPETLSCIDIDNKIKEYTTVTEILDDFIKVRLEYYQKRKDYLLNKYDNKLKLLTSKHTFCKSIIDNKLILNNRKKDDIIKDIEKISKIIKQDDSYNYLLNMPIHSITYETLNTLNKEIASIKEKLDTLKDTTIKQLWLNDLEDLKKYLKNSIK